MKKTKLFLLLIAFSCGEKQDYENDIKIPTILKDYSIIQKEEVREKTNSRSKSDTSSSSKKIRTHKSKIPTNRVDATEETEKQQ
jgi:hypothetical protein